MCSKVIKMKEKDVPDLLPVAVYFKEQAPVVTDLFADFCTGVVLHKLLVALFAGRGAKIRQINETPKSTMILPCGCRVAFEVNVFSRSATAVFGQCDAVSQRASVCGSHDRVLDAGASGGRR
jgi:hypothetical protein